MQNQTQTGAIAIAAAALAANLPDPRQPTIILFLAGLGALTGSALGRIRRLRRAQTRELAENWSFLGGVTGAVLYVTALLASLTQALGWTPSTVSEPGTTAVTVAAIAESLKARRR